MRIRRDEAEAALDRWVREALRERFALALREPLPETLLHLLDASERQAPPPAQQRQFSVGLGRCAAGAGSAG
jgi:hypothetical protein